MDTNIDTHIDTHMDITNCNDVLTLITIKNECIRYKNNIKTKQNLVSCLQLHNIKCNFIEKNFVNVDGMIKEIDSQLLKYCNHCWRQEWIDVSYDEAKLVTYCENCEITQI